MHKTKCLCLLLIFMFSFGCEKDSDKIKAGWKILTISAVSYNTIMGTTAALYEKGEISEQEKEKIIVVGNSFYKSYSLSVDALESYSKVPGYYPVSVYEKSFLDSVTSVHINLFALIDTFNHTTKDVAGINNIQKPEIFDEIYK